MWLVLRLHKWEDLNSNWGQIHGTPYEEKSPGYLPVFETKEDAEKYGQAIEIQEAER